ncbi:MAG TPA: single-stranded-DNA-specific exonuclease RecJ [Pyrinomonadaceae bacterium]|nr:single-stranded-DNA-specific exonuclease RecJ [Pyrinomonadaceae bacterium]
MEKRWVIKKHDHGRAAALAAELNVSPLVAALLIARGYDDAEKATSFLNPSYDHLHEPYLLKGMREAVERLFRAIDAGEKILVWGDYDVDGTTGTVLLRKMLKILGAETAFHVPNRFTEGYGINIPALEQAKADGCKVVVSVDCGIRSFEPIAWAKENGLDFIVTDHHISDPERGNPDAYAVINPNQPECEYPDKHLAGVGVAFKLAHAMLREKKKDHLVPAFLKITAIGTVADIMQLTGENRAIVALGLRDLPNTRNYGLKALMEVADCRSDMTSYHIGFRIAPRINAAGRMDVAKHVVELFECEDFVEARKLATILDSRNRERQQVQQQITELALMEATEMPGRKFVVVAGDGWHRGVIGLAASRIAERLHRPTIVLSVEDGYGHGSARSIANYHLLNALESCPELFEQFGGHAAAAGMKVKQENIDAVREALNAYAETSLTEDHLQPELKIDARVSPQTLNLGLVSDLAKLEPFGAGNPKPVFVTSDLVVHEEPRVMKEKHLKIWLDAGGGQRFEAVWWDGVERSKERTLTPGSRIEVAYTAEANVWQSNVRLQLVVEDIRADN